MKNDQQEIDIAVLRNDVEYLKKWVNTADTNHFPTIERRFDKIDNKLSYWGGALALLTIIVPILLKIFFK